jgi:hypothetical protein
MEKNKIERAIGQALIGRGHKNFCSQNSGEQRDRD